MKCFIRVPLFVNPVSIIHVRSSSPTFPTLMPQNCKKKWVQADIGRSAVAKNDDVDDDDHDDDDDDVDDDDDSAGFCGNPPALERHLASS